MEEEFPIIERKEIGGYILLRCIEEGIDMDWETLSRIFDFEMEFMEQKGM